MKNNFKKIAAVISASLLSALPMATSLSANAAPADDTVKYVFGDVISDGKIDAADAQKVLMWATKKPYLTAEQKKRADVNGDGKITDDDAQKILNYYTSAVLAKNKIYGDADGNGKVNTNDAIMVEQYVNRGAYKGQINLVAADLNADGVVNKCDYRLIARYAMHYNVDTLYVNWGDVDSDGYITNADAQKLSKFIAEDRNVRLTDAEKRRADVDTDGKITTDDVVAILLRASSGKFSWAK